jgi:hypothetical protein
MRDGNPSSTTTRPNSQAQKGQTTLMSKTKQLIGLLSSLGIITLALAAVTAPSASAVTLKVCKKVPASLKGLWKTSEECDTTKYETEGKFAWAWPTNNGTETVYCVLGGTSFTDDLCEDSGSGPFLERTTKEAFPKLEASLSLPQLKTTIGGLPANLHCTGGSFTGQPLTQTLLSGGAITYTGCDSSITNCELDSPGEPTGIIKTKPLDVVLDSLTLANFEPEEASTFVEIKILGSSCAAKVTLPIKGEQMCAIGGPVSPSLPALLHLLECAASGSNLKLGSEPATYESTAHVKVAGDLWWKIN